MPTCQSSVEALEEQSTDNAAKQRLYLQLHLHVSDTPVSCVHLHQLTSTQAMLSQSSLYTPLVC